MQKLIDEIRERALAGGDVGEAIEEAVVAISTAGELSKFLDVLASGWTTQEGVAYSVEISSFLRILSANVANFSDTTANFDEDFSSDFGRMAWSLFIAAGSV